MQRDIGQQLGRYKLLAVLGTGGFATVFRAEDTQLGRHVALKLLHPHLAHDPTFRQRFYSEARQTAALRHASIVPIYDLGETDDGRFYIVMMLLEGSQLSERLLEQGPFDLDAAAAIAEPLAAALDYLHTQGIVHRDLNPANVMVSDTGDVTLMDFGIARSLKEQSRFTQVGQIVGTPTYMAPEQCSGGEITPATDIYAFGILIYHMLSGRPPFEGETTTVLIAHLEKPPPPLRSIRPGLPEAVYAAIESALAKDPAARPASARALASALTGRAERSSAPRPAVRPPRPTTVLPAADATPITPPVDTAGESPVSVGEPPTPAGEPPRSASEPPTLAGEPPTPGREPAPHTTRPPAPSTRPPADRTALVPTPASEPPDRAEGPLAPADETAAPAEPLSRATDLPPRTTDLSAQAAEPPEPPAEPLVPAATAPTPAVAGPPPPPARPHVPPTALSPVPAPEATPGEPPRTRVEPVPPTTPPRPPTTAPQPPRVATRPPDTGGRSLNPILLGGGIGALILIVAVAAWFFLWPRDRAPAVSDRPAATAAPATAPSTAPTEAKAAPTPTTASATPAAQAKAAVPPVTDAATAASPVTKGAVPPTPNAKTDVAKTAPSPTAAPPPPPRLVVATLAGSGRPGFADGAGAEAQFTSPSAVASAGDGSILVADTGNNRIRQIAADGSVTTLAGSVEGGLTDGSGTAAQFNGPAGVVRDGAGNVYVADTFNHRIRKITPNGVVTTLAGSGTAGLGGGGFRDGPAAQAEFRLPTGIALDAAGNLYVADKGNHRIRKIAPNGTVSTVAGSANPAGGFRDGPANTAEFNSPGGIASDAAGTLYVADTFNHRIRKIARGMVTTLAGAADPGPDDGQGAQARFNFPEAIAVGPGDTLYVADSSNHRIRKVTLAGAVTTVVGDGEGSTDDPAEGARFSFPKGVAAAPDGALYVADTNNHRVRKMAP